MLHATTREERASHVAQMRVNFALEGISPGSDDLELLQRYITGQISIDEMLEHARDFAHKAAKLGGAFQS